MTHKKSKVLGPMVKAWEKAFLVQKLNNPAGYFLAPVIAIFFGYIMATKLLIGLGLIALLIGLPIIFICLFNTETGFYVNMVYSFFAFHLSRMLFSLHFSLPVGVISDILTISTFLSLFIRRPLDLKRTLNEFTHTGVVKWLLVIYAYFALQLFNPNANSFFGWYSAFRKILETLLLFFTVYTVFDSREKIHKFIKIFFILSALSGLYGCIQEWHGLFDFEKAWLMSDPHGFALAFIGGSFRKFGTMSDPAAYSEGMAACATFFIAYLSCMSKRSSILIVLAGIAFMVLGCSYSGTRTGNAMLIGGLALFFLLTFDQKRSRYLAVGGVVIFLAALFGPFNNSTIARFRSTFNATEDASYNVREENRKSIQPYIYTHPIGGGLATTDATGILYNPGHYLAGFQTDSGYLKKALEIGPIGLIFFCIFYFLVLRMGIRGYFRNSDKKIKTIFAAATCALFCFYLGDYSQKAIGQVTDLVIYYPLIAILLRLMKLNPGDGPTLIKSKTDAQQTA